MWQSVILLAILTGTPPASEPTVDSIDYATPAKYLAIPSTLGNEADIARQALALKADNDRKTIRNVLDWMDANLKYEPDRAYEWRNYDKVVQQGCYGGCADQGIVCGVLLKSAGIPTVWVKTMDVPWIWDLKKHRPFTSWSGHVFLEVYVDKKWVLLDPGAKLIYIDYSPKSRILPGNWFAYHKGNEPKEMIMSLQWEQWKRQTRSYFSKLDEGLLPIDPTTATSLQQQCFVIANSPYYQTLSAMAQRKGLTVRKSFNTQYDRYLPQAIGHVILIEAHDGVPIVELTVLEKYFPAASNGLRSPEGAVAIGDTTIIFVDFAKLLDPLDIDAAERKPLGKAKNRITNR